MTADWQPVTLGDLVDIKHGFAFKGEYITENETGDVLLTPGNFAIGGGFQWGKRKFYSGPVSDEYVLRAGDIIVSMTDLSKEADTLGYAARVPFVEKRLLHNQRLGKLVFKVDRLKPSFAHWLLRTEEYRNEVLANYTGSTVKHTSPTKIRAFAFLLPPNDEQDAISGILDALDDKIELNRRMNATLEELARSLYQSWFVDFDPVHARALGQPPVHMAPATFDLFPDSFGPDGLPKGWEAGTLGDIALNIRRQVQPGEIESATPYIGLEHMPRGSIALSEWGEAGQVGSAKSVMRRGQILFGKLRPYFHKVGVVPTDGICSTDILVIGAKADRWREMILNIVSSEDFVEHANATASGTRMPRSNWRDMARYEIAVPPEAVAGAFSGIVRPMTKKIEANIHEAHTLAALRDALLPRLMSGELRIREAEKQVEALA